MSDLDDIIHVSVHKEDVKSLPKNVQKFVNDYSDIEFYPEGLKSGKKFNKVKEFKRLLKELESVRSKNNGKESNIECIVYDQLQELMQRMMLSELRELNLERLK